MFFSFQGGFQAAMKQRLSVALGRASGDRECGFGEEVRVMEPLTLLPSFCAQHALDAE